MFSIVTFYLQLQSKPKYQMQKYAVIQLHYWGCTSAKSKQKNGQAKAFSLIW
jgi:hypothetical protein